MLARTPDSERRPPKPSRAPHGPTLTSAQWDLIVGFVCIAVFVLVAWFVLEKVGSL